MHKLTTQDYRNGWRLVCEMTEAASDAVAFGRQGSAGRYSPAPTSQGRSRP